jgi:hypothetical protein
VNLFSQQGEAMLKLFSKKHFLFFVALLPAANLMAVKVVRQKDIKQERNQLVQELSSPNLSLEERASKLTELEAVLIKIAKPRSTTRSQGTTNRRSRRSSRAINRATRPGSKTARPSVRGIQRQRLSGTGLGSTRGRANYRTRIKANAR